MCHIYTGHAVENLSVDSNATIMAFGNPQGACKVMFLDPKTIIHAVTPLTHKNCVTQIDKALLVKIQKLQ